MWFWKRLGTFLSSDRSPFKRRARWNQSQRDRSVSVETLEKRRPLTTVTAYEQYFLELLNQARANPTATATKYGIDLNEGLPAGTISSTPKQPLALNDSLQAAIDGHLADELAKGYFSHTGSDGSTPTTRMVNAGYTNWTSLGENLAIQYTTGTANVLNFVNDEFKNLFVDATVADRGHRVNMMTDGFQETGSGVVQGTYTPAGTSVHYSAVLTGNDFGSKSQNSFVTGVAYTDAVTVNNFYTVGEGLGGVTVTVVGGPSQSTYTTTTNSVGGYQLAVPAGSYTVTFSGTGVTGSIIKSFSISNKNVEVDLNTRVDKATFGPPALAGTNVINYQPGAAPQSIDSVLVVTDPGRTTLSLATVTISNFLGSEDLLGFVPNAATMGNVAIVSNSGGVLRLSSAGSTATLSQWQSALRAVTYANSSNSPTTTTRNVTFVVDDGAAANHLSNTLTTSVTLSTPNHAPVGTPATVTGLEDVGYTFKVADFGFTDPGDTPPDQLQAVVITTLPAAGVLMDGVTAVTAGDVIPLADLTGSKLKFTGAANANGLAYANFTFQVQDNGGTANGGANTDLVARSMTVNLTAVNDAPVGTPTTVTTLEDKPYIFQTANFGFTDPNDNPANALKSVIISTLPAAGILSDNGVAVKAGAVIPVADITGSKLKFMPAANASSATYANFTFRVQDNGGTANGGVDTDSTARALTISVTPVNDAPAGKSATVTTLEDTPYAFKIADFGFTDPLDVPANAFLSVLVKTLPVRGTLTDNGVAVVKGSSVLASHIASGLVKFLPAANGNGTAYASFVFDVQDNGGTANGGVNTDPVSRVMTVNVTSVNDAPAGRNGTVATLEDTAYVFKVADFGFSDPNDVPANALQSVTIKTLPARGTLTDNGIAVVKGSAIPASDIANGLLRFTPVANTFAAAYGSFVFGVRDNGGTANRGVDTDPLSRSMTINVTSVNDAPVGTAKTITTLEDSILTFKTIDFGFTDPHDVPANAFLSVVISSLPANGLLTDNGVAVTAGAMVTLGEIAGSKLKWTPGANAFGLGYGNFTFQVRDNGGTANGGIDTDPTPRLMTINVTSVNDQPGGTSATVTTLEDSSYTFQVSDFGFTDPNDNPENAFQGVKITTIPSRGVIFDQGIAVTAGTIIPVQDVTNGWLQFTPATNGQGTPYISFTFQVQDDGGTANGGRNLDLTPNVMTINVTSVNDAPTGTAHTVTTAKTALYQFKYTDFGYSDPNDNPLNPMAAVFITTLPDVGTLTDNGVAVTEGQRILVADITGGKLRFNPGTVPDGTTSTSFTFQVQDSGGTANGGIDTDPLPKLMTINLT